MVHSSYGVLLYCCAAAPIAVEVDLPQLISHLTLLVRFWLPFLSLSIRRNTDFLGDLDLFSLPASSALTFLRIFTSIPFMLDMEQIYEGKKVGWGVVAFVSVFPKGIYSLAVVAKENALSDSVVPRPACSRFVNWVDIERHSRGTGRSN